MLLPQTTFPLFLFLSLSSGLPLPFFTLSAALCQMWSPTFETLCSASRSPDHFPLPAWRTLCPHVPGLCSPSGKPEALPVVLWVGDTGMWLKWCQRLSPRTPGGGHPLCFPFVSSPPPEGQGSGSQGSSPEANLVIPLWPHESCPLLHWPDPRGSGEFYSGPLHTGCWWPHSCG